MLRGFNQVLFLSLSPDKSQPNSLRNSDTEKYFSMKGMNDNKITDSKSFVSTRNNNEDLPSSRGQSTDKLKKTTTLYNKAQNDLIKKLKLNASPTATTAASDSSQGNSTVNIQKFLQGSVTTTNRNSTPKTPVRNMISSRMSGNTMSNSNLNAHLKKPEQKVSTAKANNSKPAADGQIDLSKSKLQPEANKFFRIIIPSEKLD